MLIYSYLGAKKMDIDISDAIFELTEGLEQILGPEFFVSQSIHSETRFEMHCDVSGWADDFSNPASDLAENGEAVNLFEKLGFEIIEGVKVRDLTTDPYGERTIERVTFNVGLIQKE